MSLDTNVLRRDLRVAVKLRAAQFDSMTIAAGCADDADRAALIGVDAKTISRARRGILGEVFMARTVVALRRHSAEIIAATGTAPSLDALFEV